MPERIQGLRHTRRLFQNIPEAARKKLTDRWRAIGNRLLGNALAETPREHGGLVSALAMRAYVAAAVVLRIGLLTKRDKSTYFYGYILDQGRRAQTVQARRRSHDGTISTYALRVGGIDREKYNFVFGRRRDFEANELPGLRSIWRDILEEASRGAGSRND